MSDKVIPLNYCAHAIEDLSARAQRLGASAPLSSAAMVRIAELLRTSVKFILPNRADLVPVEDLRQAHVDLARLPYPCVAFEMPWEQEPVLIAREGPYQEKVATKRIALCWEPHPQFELLPGLYSVLNRHPGGGVFVLPIFWGPEIGSWSVPLGGTFFPYENELVKGDAKSVVGPSRAAIDAIVGAGLGKANASQFDAEPFFLFPEFFEAAVRDLGSRDKAYTNIILDSRDEVMVLLKACSVLNCANVGTAALDASPALNKKRRASGKQPFFSYKILQLTGQAESASRPAGGAHASPRTHLRRGHLRRLEYKTVWVRATLVAASAEAGFVAKDYALAKPSDS